MTNILTHRCGVSMISSAVIHVSWVTYLLRTRVPRPVANIHLLLLFTLTFINPLMGTLKPQSNGPLYSNTVIGTLAVDRWAYILVQRWGAWACWAPSSPLFSVTNVTTHPSTASVPTSYYSTWHLWTLKGQLLTIRPISMRRGITDRWIPDADDIKLKLFCQF